MSRICSKSSMVPKTCVAADMQRWLASSVVECVLKSVQDYTVYWTCSFVIAAGEGGRLHVNS
jgi:hypothetical protein